MRNVHGSEVSQNCECQLVLTIGDCYILNLTRVRISTSTIARFIFIQFQCENSEMKEFFEHISSQLGYYFNIDIVFCFIKKWHHIKRSFCMNNIPKSAELTVMHTKVCRKIWVTKFKWKIIFALSNVSQIVFYYTHTPCYACTMVCASTHNCCCYSCIVLRQCGGWRMQAFYYLV